MLSVGGETRRSRRIYERMVQNNSMTPVEVSSFKVRLSPAKTLLGCGRSDGMRSDAG